MNGLQIGITVGLVIAVLTALLAAAKRAPGCVSTDGTTTLRYSRLIAGMGWFGAIVFLLAIPVSGWVYGFKNVKEAWLAVGVGGGMVVISVIMILESMTTISFDAEHIRAWSFWKGSREMRWDEITDVKYSSANMWFILTGRNDVRIRAHLFLKGIGSFAGALYERIDPQVRRRAEAGFRVLSQFSRS